MRNSLIPLKQICNRELNRQRAGRSFNSGFTLTEAVLTVIILGVLAALAIPRYQTNMERVKTGEAVQILYALYKAQMDYRIDTNTFTGNMKDLAIDIPAPKHYAAPKVSAGVFVNCNGSGNQLASIADDKGKYTLFMLETGNIRCTPCNGSICRKLGFTEL